VAQTPLEGLFDQEAKHIGFDERRDLIAKLELVQHFMDVGRKSVEKCL
jgi:hypothetical protein